MVRPKNHPAIFECKYCHSSVVKDFATRSHKKLRCTTCHIYFKETAWSGRIIRDADPRFCLLCHRGAKFRAEDAPPSIEWPSHREDMGDGPEDANKRCIDCHQDENIHQLQTKKASGGAVPAVDKASAPVPADEKAGGTVPADKKGESDG